MGTPKLKRQFHDPQNILTRGLLSDKIYRLTQVTDLVYDGREVVETHKRANSEETRHIDGEEFGDK